MTEIDARAGDGTAAVRFIIIGICRTVARLLRQSLGRKGFREVALVRESVGDAPADVCLLHVGERFATQGVPFVPQEAIFKFREGSELGGLVVPKERSFSVEVARAAATPRTLGEGQHRRVEIVLNQDRLLVGDETVVPNGQNSTCQVVAPPLLAIDAAVVESNKVGKRIEVVDIVKTAVDGGNSLLGTASIAPELRHGYLSRLVVPARIPGDAILAQGADESDHSGDKVGVGETNFVRADVDIGNIEGLANLRKYFLQDSHPLFRLHIGAEGAAESFAMARHINLGDKQHFVSFAESYQIAGLLQGVELAGHTGHIFRLV